MRQLHGGQIDFSFACNSTFHTRHSMGTTPGMWTWCEKVGTRFLFKFTNGTPCSPARHASRPQLRRDEPQLRGLTFRCVDDWHMSILLPCPQPLTTTGP